MGLFARLKALISSKPATDATEQSGDNLDLSHVTHGDDDDYMDRALQLASKGLYTTHPNPVVGCVIVNNGRIVGQGWHEFAGQAHAEVIALKQAGKLAAGGTLYVNLEPCSHRGKTPPCVKAIIKANIGRVVIAIEDPNPKVNGAGIEELQGAGIVVKLGVRQEQARQINRGFLKRITTGFPWVTLKIATSLDGKTAMANGESQWITAQPARQDAHKLRAEAAAILTGIGTVLRDDPNMKARLAGVQRQPLRVILDTHLSTPADAKILSGQGNALIITANSENSASKILQNDSVEVVNMRRSNGKMDLNEVMLELGKREINTILLEAGSRLSGSMLEAGLVDEIVVYMAPDLLGSDARDMLEIAGLEQISDKVQLDYKEVTRVGRDLKLTLTLSSASQAVQDGQ